MDINITARTMALKSGNASLYVEQRKLEHPALVTAVAVRERYVATGCYDGIVRAFERETGTLVATLRGLESKVFTVELTARRLLGCAAATAWLWTADDFQVLVVLALPSSSGAGTLCCAALSDTYAAVGGSERLCEYDNT